MELNYKFYFKSEVKPLLSLSLQEIACFECPCGYVFPLEKPNAYSLYIVYDGKGVYTSSGTKYHVKQNDIFAIYPGSKIKFQADKEDPCTLLTVTFDGIEARLLMNAAGFQPQEPVRHLEEKVAEMAVNICIGIHKFSSQSILGGIQSTTSLYGLMSLLVKTATLDYTETPVGWTGVIHYNKAVEFILNNYSRAISVDDIAAHVNLSRSRLYRIFMQHAFISPIQFLLEYRVREGRNLLEKRAGSVKEIAHAVGFDDPLRFSKVFKQITGYSPVNYMKMLAKK